MIDDADELERSERARIFERRWFEVGTDGSGPTFHLRRSAHGASRSRPTGCRGLVRARAATPADRARHHGADGRDAMGGAGGAAVGCVRD